MQICAQFTQHTCQKTQIELIQLIVRLSSIVYAVKSFVLCLYKKSVLYCVCTYGSLCQQTPVWLYVEYYAVNSTRQRNAFEKQYHKYDVREERPAASNKRKKKKYTHAHNVMID